MSHQAITAGAHHDGVYHDSHALEGGSEGNGIIDWQVDTHNRRIVVQTSSNFQLWDMDGGGLIGVIRASTGGETLLYANFAAANFWTQTPAAWILTAYAGGGTVATILREDIPIIADVEYNDFEISDFEPGVHAKVVVSGFSSTAELAQNPTGQLVRSQDWYIKPSYAGARNSSIFIKRYYWECWKISGGSRNDTYTNQRPPIYTYAIYKVSGTGSVSLHSNRTADYIAGRTDPLQNRIYIFGIESNFPSGGYNTETGHRLIRASGFPTGATIGDGHIDNAIRVVTDYNITGTTIWALVWSYTLSSTGAKIWKATEIGERPYIFDNDKCIYSGFQLRTGYKNTYGSENIVNWGTVSTRSLKPDSETTAYLAGVSGLNIRVMNVSTSNESDYVAITQPNQVGGIYNNQVYYQIYNDSGNAKINRMDINGANDINIVSIAL